MHEAAAFYRGRDAEGVATVLEQNAVSGRDLAEFASWQDVHAELRVTPFLAKKAIRVRDSFLVG